MIESIAFRNFRVLKDARLNLGPFNLIIGAHNSGKSTVLKAIQIAAHSESFTRADVASIGGKPKDKTEILIRGSGPFAGVMGRAQWDASGVVEPKFDLTIPRTGSFDPKSMFVALSGVPIYAFDPQVMARPTALEPDAALHPDGGNLAGVLDRLRDEAPERFEALNTDLARCLPEFDRVMFETPATGQRALRLRTKAGGHPIPAVQTGQGALLLLGLLALAHQPAPPPLVCIEEPHRGIHPRLLQSVRDLLYQLSYPDRFDDAREPVKVIVTSYSAYMLDLFQGHPEEIIIADRKGLFGSFSRLSERADLAKITEDSRLSELWYAGVLGGVPAAE